MRSSDDSARARTRAIVEASDAVELGEEWLAGDHQK
jgi:hypothetical protein